MKEPSKIWNILKASVPIFIVSLLLIAFGFAYSWNFSKGLYRDEYEGRIVDKPLTFSETQQGSGIRRRLLIEDKNGSRFEVAVKVEVYDRAQVGMLIKNVNSKIHCRVHVKLKAILLFTKSKIRL